MRGFGDVPDGENVSAMRQVESGWTVAPFVQVVPEPDTIAKSELGVPLVPVIEGAAVILRGALPVFVTVSV